MRRRYLEWGKAWSLLAGDETSQTQYSAASNDGVYIWNHPIDVHFATASMQGWPRIIIQLFELDEYGRSILSGYGFTHLPTNPGEILFDMTFAMIIIVRNYRVT
jgi:B9 domain-containing protein 2